MSGAGASARLLLVLNVIHVVFGLAITAASIWFFVEVHSVTSLRNTNHYLLDYNVYWPQAIPWVFMLVGVLVLCVSCCGFVAAKKRSNGFVVMYIALEAVIVLALVIATVVALALADTKSTDKFIEDTIWDVYFHMKTDREVESAFGNMEKRIQCCGAAGPRDYINWRSEFPVSCCDTYYHGWIGEYQIECDFTNKLANERHGCSEVAANYTRIVMRVLSAAAVFTALIGIMNVVVAITLSKSIKKRPRVVQHPIDPESKKVLL